MKRLELLDYGRFFAAIMVVLYHYTFNGIANGKLSSLSHIPELIEFTKYGYLGVELFFMISGYVIFYSARNRSAAQFAASRAIRLYPSYWFAVLFTSAIAWMWATTQMQVTPLQTLVNLSMFQSYLGIGHVDGVYWTLVLEVQFYVLVLLCLFLGWQDRLEILFSWWPVVMVLALLAGLDRAPLLGGYFSYFAAGALFAILKEKANWKSAASLAVAFGLCVRFSLEVADEKAVETGAYFSPVVVASMICLFFAFFLTLNLEKVQQLRLPFSKTMGALTYPVYLIHAHFGYMFLSRFATDQNRVWMYPLAIAIVLVVAYGMNRFIEIGLAGTWKKLANLTVYRAVDGVQRLSAGVLRRPA